MSASPSNKAGYLTEYYRSPAVRERISDFLGGASIDSASCLYITASSAVGETYQHENPRTLSAFLNEGCEISRSLWDQKSLLAHLDIEYVNFDFPGEVYLNPERTFGLQSPVVEATERLLHACDIHPLHILSGRGHHFVWQISQSSPEFQDLAGIGAGAHLPQPAGTDCEVRASPQFPPIRLAEAFAGLGLVVELLAHEIKESSAPRCDIPVELTAVEVGPRTCGREMVSIDVSEYGDPLPARTIRVPFSIYLKPLQQRAFVGGHVVENLSPIFFIPFEENHLAEGLRTMRDPGKVNELAERISTKIPNQDEGMGKLIERYANSSLSEFHAWFYSREHEPDDVLQSIYGPLPTDRIPSCANQILLHPNDLLLHPSGLRLITRVFLALGWHPRHIAGMIATKFREHHEWGTQWDSYDPAMRADFYTRIFSGLFTLGRDDLVDFNCRSSQEERTCPFAQCPGNLNIYRESALLRRQYGYLAHRPFNRLFLPNKHS